MNNEQLLKDLCENLQDFMNIDDNMQTVTYFLGLKPSGYYAPQMVFTHKQAMEAKVTPAIFCEIFVNGKCIFRDSHMPDETEDLEICKEVIAMRVIRNVFNYGVMA